MQYEMLQRNLELYVRKLFKNYCADNLIYHNLTHTEEVAAHAIEIAHYYELNTEDFFILIAAAWFHDTGHLFVPAMEHEEESIKQMKDYFKEKNISETLLERIEECINATKYPPEPKSVLDRIICDADTYNFGTDEFKITDEKVRKEMELICNKSATNWHEGSLFLLSHHRYYTNYCKTKLQAGNEQNIQYLQLLIEKGKDVV